MKKFIAAFDGLKFSESTLDYTLYLASQADAHVVGVFLDDVVYHTYGYKEIVSYDGPSLDNAVHQWNDEDRFLRDESVNVFEEACRREGIKFSIHRDRNVALQELIHESIYADLLIVNSKESFNNKEETLPTQFLKDLLSDVQCPVLLVPDRFAAFERLNILYDGEPPSVYSIKMFSYLLPVFKNLDTDVLTVRSEENSLHLPDHRLIKEFMKRHFPKAEYQVYKGLPEDQIISALYLQKQNSLVVLGANQRSRVSRWFRPSMTEVLLKHINLPLFIAHNN
jgi:Universal stress protein UspA and related nucleotide-binding proteins